MVEEVPYIPKVPPVGVRSGLRSSLRRSTNCESSTVLSKIVDVVASDGVGVGDGDGDGDGLLFAAVINPCI